MQVAYRWGELSDVERQQLARGCQSLLVGTGNTPATWAVRSKAALLVALVTKRMGQPFWEAMLPELLAYAGQGPVQAEKARPASLLHGCSYARHSTRRLVPALCPSRASCRSPFSSGAHQRGTASCCHASAKPSRVSLIK